MMWKKSALTKDNILELQLGSHLLDWDNIFFILVLNFAIMNFEPNLSDAIEDFQF